MKKTILHGALLASLSLLSLIFTSCSEDEPKKEIDRPSVSEGFFVLNQGNFYQNIEGSLNFYNPFTDKVETNIFRNANKRSLGDTPQCAAAYGSKIYIGTYSSSTIEILDAETFISLKQIKLNAGETGSMPRSMVTEGGKVYITMYDGYVARLDTVTLNIDAKVKVGPNPEEAVIFRNKLYVPNSDGMNQEGIYGKTASIIDLPSFTVESTVEVPENPSAFVVANNRLFLLSKGNYRDMASKIYEIDPDIVSLQKEGKEGYTPLVNATFIAESPQYLYYMDVPFYSDTRVIGRIDLSSGRNETWDAKEVEYPNSIAVDPNTREVIIGSYIYDGPYPSYIAPGYIVRYSDNLIYNGKNTVGSGPSFIFFR
ncbi:MAG: hypothetical protein K2M13_10995 [Muribaculaceae bacterium]|nr:hypothetical protein [Muribaculaceae bacterium]